MTENLPASAKRLFQIGALVGVPAGVLMPYHTTFYLLLALICLVWLSGCFLCRGIRSEFAKAQKYLILAILLIGLDAFLPSGTLRALLHLAVCMLLYFSAALQCGGIAALAERCGPNDRAQALPGAVTRFEYAMIVFAAAQMIGANVAMLGFISDLVGMGALVLGFLTLWKYFSGKEAVK